MDVFFGAWSLTWLVWVLTFLVLAMTGHVIGATIIGSLGFIALWIVFCDGMGKMQQHKSKV